ncbi:MAG: hypothetical protein V9G19_07445 [Tetrasphaera sp.]
MEGGVLRGLDRPIAIPKDWSVLAVYLARDDVVLDVSSFDERFAVLATGTTLERLTAVAPPLAIDRFGQVLLGRSVPATVPPVDSATPSVAALFSLADRKVLDIVQLPDDTSVVDVCRDAGLALVETATGTAYLSDISSGRARELPVPGEVRARLSATGDAVFVTTDQGRLLRLEPADLSTAWEGPVLGTAPVLSPDGRYVAGVSDRKVVVVEAASGRQAKPATLLRSPTPEPMAALVWESDKAILVTDHDAVEQHWQRCTLSTGTCASVPTTSSGTVVASPRPD